MGKIKIVCVIGATASGKSARAVELAKERDGEVISVDSRQVYRGLDIGTEKVSKEEMQGVPHYLIDIRDPQETYSAGDFVEDASRLIQKTSGRGKVPILVGGSHFYFDALMHGLPPQTPPDKELRAKLEKLSNEELLRKLERLDSRRAKELDPKNRRRLIRAIEIAKTKGVVPARQNESPYEVTWVVLDPPEKELREKIEKRLRHALENGLVEEVRRVRECVGDGRLNELGLEYRIIGEFLRGERGESSLLPTLISKLWQYSRRQRAWVRKLLG